MAPREKLIDTKLRLSEQERADVERLRGDRVQNTCFRRAVQQWILREEMLQEAMRLGHPIPAVHADGPIPVQPSATERSDSRKDVTRISRSNVKEPSKVSAVPDAEPPDEDDDEDDQPARRRPPTSAETWGSGGPRDAS